MQDEQQQRCCSERVWPPRPSTELQQLDFRQEGHDTSICPICTAIWGLASQNPVLQETCGPKLHRCQQVMHLYNQGLELCAWQPTCRAGRQQCSAAQLALTTSFAQEWLKSSPARLTRSALALSGTAKYQGVACLEGLTMTCQIKQRSLVFSLQSCLQASLIL